MKKLIGIVGIPGTGKTTLVLEWMKLREWEEDKPIKLLDSYVSGDFRLFGKYEDGEVFAGTDKLSMAVQPEAIKYLRSENASKINIFEGDRLTSVKFFREAIDLGYDVKILILIASSDIIRERYKQRGSEQSEKFIQGRWTKIENIKEEFGEKILTGDPSYFEIWVHETEEDTKDIIKRIEEIC